MASSITSERIAEYKRFLKEHPIDHKYDELAKLMDCEKVVPREQLAARIAYRQLKKYGELE